MSLFPWPFRRKQYAGINNPRFVGDIVAANEAVLDAMTAMSGMGATDFAIISGLDFVGGVPNTYTPGIFYLNGSFYIQQTSFQEGLYLSASPTDTMPEVFQDGNSRNIYTVQYGVTTAVPTGNSPVFSGNMNAYRIGLKYVQSAIKSLQSVAAGLGNSSVLNIGTASGTVAAGDDPRLVYTQSQFNTIFGMYALLTQVLIKGNTVAFTPSLNYDPATKKYVDDNVGLYKIVYAAIVHLGDIGVPPNQIDANSSSFPIAFPTALSDNRYVVGGSLVGLSVSPLTDKDVIWNVSAPTASGFNLIVREIASAGQNLQFNFTITKIP